MKRGGTRLSFNLLIVVNVIRICNGFNSGAPSSACSTLVPGHGVPSQTSAVPFKLDVSAATVESEGEVILNLGPVDDSDVDSKFKGFLVQALDEDGSTVVGSFQITDANLMKTLSCMNNEDNSITHTSSLPKSRLQLSWKAPKTDRDLTVNFFFSIVQEFSVFWVKQPGSNALRVKKSDAESENVESENVEPENAEPEKSDLTSTVSKLDSLHEGCGVTRGCFGLPANCISDGSCRYLLAYSHDSASQKVKMSLKAQNLSSDNYFAMGLSLDARMGEDLVFFCHAGEKQSISVRWNQGKNNIDGVLGKVPFPPAMNLSSVDGITTCDFFLDETIEVTPPGESDVRSFDLANEDYFLLIAVGKMSGDALTFHETRQASGAAVNFKSFTGAVTASRSYLVQVHGALMALAWLASAASGAVIARYFKGYTWASKPVSGAAIWFHLHRSLMMFAVVATLISFGVIWGSVGFFPYTMDFIRKNPHPATGGACIVLALIQPIMAMFRPHPGDGIRRKGFNFLHWFVGNLARLMALISFFLAVELPGPKLPTSLTIALIVYVVVELVVHAVFTYKQVVVAKARRSAVSGGDVNPSVDSKVGNFVFAIFVSFAWIFAIAFVILIFLSVSES